MAKTRNALRILGRVTGDDPQLQADIADARVNFRVAQMIYDARIRAGLSQRELAELIGTKQPVIARLEDANYEGHSLAMLQRIAKALDRQLDIRFVSVRRRPSPHLRVRRRTALAS